MGRLIILLALIAGLLLFLNWFRKTPPHQVANVLRKSALWGAIGLLLLATLTGRLNPVFAAIAAAVPVFLRVLHLVRMLPVIQQLLHSLGLGMPGTAGRGTAAPGSAGGSSTIRTAYLDMTLDHQTGQMDGTVREGPFAGRCLSELELEQLLRMLELYQDSDDQSASVLTAYLDRERGDHWRDSVDAGSASRAGYESDRFGSDGSGSADTGMAKGMSRDDAFAVLGLPPHADAEAIRTAHRRLMQKLHPDRGGSDYLAAQINAAKTLLLDE